MKLLYNVAAAASVIFIAVGFIDLARLGLFGTGLGTSIIALPCALALNLGLYVFQLRDRVAVLEQRISRLAE